MTSLREEDKVAIYIEILKSGLDRCFNSTGLGSIG